MRPIAVRVVRRRLAREVPLDERDTDTAAATDAILHQAILGQALGRLPEHYRDPIVLHHLMGLSFRDIAGIVGSSEGGARIRASRACRRSAACSRTLRRKKRALWQPVSSA